MNRLSSVTKLACCSLALVFLITSGISLAEEETASSNAILLPANESSPSSPADEPIAGMKSTETTWVSSATWQFASRESCYDMFEQSCYQSHFPDPFCPSNPAGKPCSPLGTSCWVIINQWWADEYYCQL